MVEVPTKPAATPDELAQWFRIKEQIKQLQASELLLRRHIFGSWFEQKEGTQKYDLPDGWVCKGELPYNYKVDEASYTALSQHFVESGITKVADLVRWKPELVKSAYNELTEEQKVVFGQCLTISPGTPQLEVVKPKAKGGGKPPATVAPQGQENL